LNRSFDTVYELGGSHLIKLNKISKSYQGTVILDQLDLTIERGEWCSIIGPSGTGKSTLLHCISGLLKPDSGEICFENTNLYLLSEKERSDFRRRNIGFVFQDFKLLPYYSVLDNVILPLIFDLPKKDLYERAKQRLLDVGIKEELFHRLPDGLSGGEKQRVAIARSLIGQPEVLICDEPTGNLDIENRDRIVQLLRELNHNGQTIIVVTHDQEVAACGNVIHQLRYGRLSSEVLA